MAEKLKIIVRWRKLRYPGVKWVGLVLLVGILGLLMVGCNSTPSPTPTLTPTVEPPTPVPTPTPEPFEPVGSPDSRLGMTWINTCYTRESANITADNEQVARSAGATWDRWPFEWGRIMASGVPVFNNPDWAINYNTPLDRDDAGGINTLAIINYGTHGTINPDGSYNDAKWREYVTTIVDTYGTQVEGWELGNENGLPENTGMSVEDFILALETACTILTDRGQDANPILLGSPMYPALSGIANEQGGRGTIDPSWRSEQWKSRLEAVAAEDSLVECINGISLHTYGRVDWSYWITSNVYAHIKRLNGDWNPGIWAHGNRGGRISV
ncbi:MAG TPA: hypothetical protein PLH19_07645 [Anaerolineae bacterium]|nr:hypothetical protein [Anaerolineae bacterium]HQH38392.1 hypothetical protein [Anaerolineae bacterium]